jgi:hypothetical protein
VNIGIWLASLLGGGGLIASVISLLTIGSQVRKAKADTVAVLSETALALLEPSKREAKDLLQKLEKVNERADTLEEKLRDAQSQVLTLTRRVDGLTDRLRLAQRLLDERGVPFPPMPDM